MVQHYILPRLWYQSILVTSRKVAPSIILKISETLGRGISGKEKLHWYNNSLDTCPGDISMCLWTILTMDSSVLYKVQENMKANKIFHFFYCIYHFQVMFLCPRNINQNNKFWTCSLLRDLCVKTLQIIYMCYFCIWIPNILQYEVLHWFIYKIIFLVSFNLVEKYWCAFL